MGGKQKGGDKSHLHFILRRGLFFGPSLRDIVGRGIHRHFKSTFISPRPERTSPAKGGYGGEKICGKVAWTIFFLFVYFIHCAGDAQYRWGEDILVCVCGLCFSSFVVVFYGDLVGSIDFFVFSLDFVYFCLLQFVQGFMSSFFSASFIYVIPARNVYMSTNIPLHLSSGSLSSQTWVEILHNIFIESYLLPFLSISTVIMKR